MSGRGAIKLDSLKEFVQHYKDRNLKVSTDLLIGLPGETEKNVWKTLIFLSKAKEVKQANFAIATPYPGTKFLEMAVSGVGGMELVSDNFTEYKRYGQAVTKVNNLGPNDLIRLQNEGFVSIYSRYWRWLPVLRKNGIIGLLLTFYRIIKMLKDKIIYK